MVFSRRIYLPLSFIKDPLQTMNDNNEALAKNITDVNESLDELTLLANEVEVKVRTRPMILTTSFVERIDLSLCHTTYVIVGKNNLCFLSSF